MLKLLSYNNNNKYSLAKRFSALAAVILIAAMYALPFGTFVYASDTDSSLPYFYDETGLLSESEANNLEKQLREISEKQNVCVAAAVVADLGGKSSEAFADDFYDYNGYGYTSAKDGVMLILSMADRDWAITTRGYGIKAMTDDAQAEMMEKVRPLLSSGKYYSAFSTFATETDNYITQSKNGNPAAWGLGSLAVGAASAAGTVFYQRSKNKSVHAKDEAAEYVKSGSLNVTSRKDIFLFRNVSRRKIERSSGSSTHTSSSGATHGGSHGKF